MALAGAGVLAFSAAQVSTNVGILADTVVADGTVQDTAGHPAVTFRAADGSVVRFVQNGFFADAAGSSVRVRYRSSDPATTARVDRFWPLWGLVLWPVPIGVGLLLLAAFNIQPELRLGRY